MIPVQHGLTPAEYLQFREPYVPKEPEIIFVLESPPKSGKYFYNPEGLVSEPLFSAMMKDVLEIKPATKDAGLREFATRGFLLLDATYTPVNHPHLSTGERDRLVLADFPLLVDELRKCSGPATKLVLVKANVCRMLDSKLTDGWLPGPQSRQVDPLPLHRPAEEIPGDHPSTPRFGAVNSSLYGPAIFLSVSSTTWATTLSEL